MTTLSDTVARFTDLQEIGRGSMGVVYRARDRARDQVVALKRLRSQDADTLLRLKREFRAIQHLRHTGLVETFELGHDHLGAFLVMEHVVGTDIARHVRNEGRAGVEALLAQLVAALDALHGHGIVHRDLKPSNVLVTPDGHVKVCDFGLLALHGDEADAGRAVGTPAYMAPEQWSGEVPLPASDMYALGALFFELLTGRPPFDGTSSELRRAHVHAAPPDPRALAPWAPEALCDAIMALLAKDPSERPTPAALAERLRLSASLVSRPPTRAQEEAPLLGREQLQVHLLGSLSHAPSAEEGLRITGLTGLSGVGKSALLRWLDRTAREIGWISLVGQSHPSDVVAFDACDGIVDGIAARLAKDEALATALERPLATAAAIFPVLALTPSATRDRDRELIRGRLFGRRDEVARRRASFLALGEILSHLARGQRVLLFIDDFQWADADSISLLEGASEHLGVGIDLVVTLRDDAGSRGQRWLRQRAARLIEVGPLEATWTAEILRRSAPTDVPSEAAWSAARACEGRPFLAEIVGRSATLGIELDPGAVLDALVRELPDAHAALLRLIVVTGEPSAAPMLASAMGAPLAATLERAALLEAKGLVRRGRLGDGTITLFVAHDLVTQTVKRLSDAGALEHAHLALYTALLAHDPSPERLVRHLVGARDRELARGHARAAADRAIERGAFSLAADMLEVIEAPGTLVSDPVLATERAEVLERAGRYGEAAAIWCELERRAPPGEDARELGLRAAHALLAANRTREGLDHLDRVLIAAGEGPTFASRLAELSAAATFAVGPLPWTAWSRSTGQGLVQRGKRDAKIGLLLAFLEPLAGIRYLQRARAAFAAAGAEELVALTELNFAVLAQIGSRAVEVPPLAQRWRRSGEARRIASEPSPELHGMAPFLDGLAALRRGAWGESKALFAEAATRFEAGEGTTERMMAASWGMMGDVYRQDLVAMEAHVAWFRRQLAREGESIIVAHVELLAAYVHVLRGRHEAARATCRALADMFDRDRPNTQRAAVRLYHHLPDIYDGEPRAPRAAYTAALADASRYRFLDSLYAGPLAGIGALLEANALRVGDPAASRRRLESLARHVDDGPPLWAGASWRARAYAADAAGDRALCLRHLERAEAESLRYQRPIDVAIARFQRARRLSGVDGETLMAEARAQLQGTGAHASLLDEDVGLRGS